MNIRMVHRQIIVITLATTFLIGCTSTSTKIVPTSIPIRAEPLPTPSITPSATPSPSQLNNLLVYQFPDSIDPAERYLIYIHGKIIEDQGLPAISPDYGEYEYQEILERLSAYGFYVISEQRPKNADGVEYARKISQQVSALLNAGVPAENITVVGASRGAGITIYASYFLENEDLNYVILGICHPDVVEDLKQNQVTLFGNVLSIYDSIDEYAGSCQELFSFSEGKGISSYDEIVLEMGIGHGLLYQPLDEWISPTVQWANNKTP